MTRREAIIVLKKNKPVSDPRGCGRELCEACDIVIEALEKQSADGCEGCKYIHKDEYEMPCLICKRNKMDKWTEGNE